MKSLETLLPLPEINCTLTTKILTTGLADEIYKTGAKKAVIGVSGGIDSALSLALSVQAIGAENITALYMPHKVSAPSSYADALAVTGKFKIPLEVIDITEPVESYFSKDKNINQFRKGNIFARMRMIILYDISARDNALVIGTSNKTEILLGYSTIWGDMASAINPIGDLYKYQIYQLSRHLKIPQSLLDKKPSADLWEGQSDEDELDLSYDLIDRTLYYSVDRGWNKERVIALLTQCNVTQEKAESIFTRVQRSQYKRKMPLILKLTYRTVDREFRYPRDWGL